MIGKRKLMKISRKVHSRGLFSLFHQKTLIYFFSTDREAKHHEHPQDLFWLWVYQQISSSLNITGATHHRNLFYVDSCKHVGLLLRTATHTVDGCWTCGRKMFFLSQMVSLAWDKDIELIPYMAYGCPKETRHLIWTAQRLRNRSGWFKMRDLSGTWWNDLVQSGYGKSQWRFSQCPSSNKQLCELDFTKPEGHFHQYIIPPF